jgi:hypothetical protein
MTESESKLIVAFYEPFRYGLDGPVEVHMGNRSAEETADDMAEYAGAHPHLIYFIVDEETFRQYYRDILEPWMPALMRPGGPVVVDSMGNQVTNL